MLLLDIVNFVYVTDALTANVHPMSVQYDKVSNLRFRRARLPEQRRVYTKLLIRMVILYVI